MSLQSLEFLLCHVKHLYPFDSLSRLLRTDWFLDDARFDLQISIIPRGSEDTVYGIGLFSEVQNRTYIVQGLLIDSLGCTKVLELLLCTPQCQGSVLPTC